jgi:hypothetical protein
MTNRYFFGYGSLVNRATHTFLTPHQVLLSGWRRIWCHTDLRPVAFLSVIRDADTQIDGMIAQVPDGDWAALDQREWAYNRVSASDDIHHPLDEDADIVIYAVPEVRHTRPDVHHPILLSYLDVVVQGYLHEFGSDGADRFLATTDGWDAPILNDRAAPRYPRHQQLTPVETAFVDERLAALSATLIDLS